MSALGTFAHSRQGRPFAEWEPLDAHLKAVAERASLFAATFGWGALAHLAGLLHDIGKLSPEFQAYIRGERKEGGDHSSAGAQVARNRFPHLIGPILSFIVAGHHAGLADGTSLDDRLKSRPKPAEGWEALVGSLPEPTLLRPNRPMSPGGVRGFSEAFLIRMLFSCLVDADFLETERFYDPRSSSRRTWDGGRLAVLRDRLRTHMDGHSREDSAVNRLRAQVLQHAVAKAASDAGFFTLTVPTGGGKTLTSLSFALEHAVARGLDRIVYVIPFTSIIEQTAAVFRGAVQEEGDADILEHHASFDWEAAGQRAGIDEEGRDGLEALRRAAENWDVPIVVTTAVQFFESLFANRASRCRKLHNLARSVIILDEAQTLPLQLLRPCMAALDELRRNYGSSIVLCTATQPALRKIDGAIVDKQKRPIGLDIDESRELAPDPAGLYTALKRVAVERLPHLVTDAEIAARFAEQPQMLCIVNTRAHAQALFALIKDLPGAVHLTTLMCPAHRRAVLADARERLKRSEPARIVSTSLIEAGVDIDLPEVWRAAAGIDSVARGSADRNMAARPEAYITVGRSFAGARIETTDARAPLRALPSLLRGSADRNSYEGDAEAAGARSLLRGSADRNVLYFRKSQSVAASLLRGSADRNSDPHDADTCQQSRSFAGARIETHDRGNRIVDRDRRRSSHKAAEAQANASRT